MPFLHVSEMSEKSPLEGYRGRFVAIVICLAAACAEFEPLDPDLTAEAPAPAAIGPRPPSRESLTFRASLLGIPAGVATFEFERRGETYTSRMHMETTGLVSLLYGVAMDAWAVSGTEDALSRRWSLTTGDEDEMTKVVVRFDPDSGQVVSVVRKPDGIERVTLDLPGALDPLGTLYALRRAALPDGATYRTVFFTRENPYRAATLVKGRERIEVPAGEFDTVMIRIDLRREKDGKAADEGSGLGIWLTDDSSRTPVRIDIDTKFGRISLRLREYERGWDRITSGRGASGWGGGSQTGVGGDVP